MSYYLKFIVLCLFTFILSGCESDDKTAAPLPQKPKPSDELVVSTDSVPQQDPQSEKVQIVMNAISQLENMGCKTILLKDGTTKAYCPEFEQIVNTPSLSRNLQEQLLADYINPLTLLTKYKYTYLGGETNKSTALKLAAYLHYSWFLEVLDYYSQIEIIDELLSEISCEMVDRDLICESRPTIEKINEALEKASKLDAVVDSNYFKFGDPQFDTTFNRSHEQKYSNLIPFLRNIITDSLKSFKRVNEAVLKAKEKNSVSEIEEYYLIFGLAHPMHLLLDVEADKKWTQISTKAALAANMISPQLFFKTAQTGESALILTTNDCSSFDGLCIKIQTTDTVEQIKEAIESNLEDKIAQSQN